jgi:hypothetical protein
MQRTLAVLARIVLLCSILVLLFLAPWHRLHPNDPKLVVSTFRAPLWQQTHPDGRLDLIEIAIEVAFVGTVSGVLLASARRMD